MGFEYILMIGLTEFANGLDVKRTKGSLAELHGIFARGTEKIGLPLNKWGHIA